MYIEREALYKTIAKNVEVFDGTGSVIKGQCLEHILTSEPADVAEVVHGRKIIHKRHRGFHWIKCHLCNHEFQSNKPYSEDVEYCSECGKKLDDTFQNYCPNCGAKMDGERRSEE